MNTLYLNPSTWDLVLDANGNIALATDPYSLAQDAASAIKTFLGEVWYNTLLGIPYWSNILGHSPPAEYMKAQFIAAALTVPEIESAAVFISGITLTRQITGQVQISTKSGAFSVATF